MTQNHVEMKLLRRLTIAEFCEEVGIKVTVRERPEVHEGDVGRYYALLPVEVKSDGTLTSPFYNGQTPELAIAGLPRIYSNKILVIDAMKNTRKEFGPFVFTE